MAVVAQHVDPVSKEDCIDTWKRFLKLSAPSRNKRILTLHIEHWADTSRFDGKPLDALLWVRPTIDVPSEIIGLRFSDQMPDERYPIRVLWVCKGEKKWLPRLRAPNEATAGGNAPE